MVVLLCYTLVWDSCCIFVCNSYWILIVDCYMQCVVDNNIVIHVCGNVPNPDNISFPGKPTFEPLELLALYTAAAAHDYEHVGRTNSFMISTAHEWVSLFGMLNNCYASNLISLLLFCHSHKA